MARTAKEITNEVKALHEKQTEEMRLLEQEREDALKIEKFDGAATELKNMYDSYVRVGFTEEQAWELVKITITNATKRTLF